MTNPVSLLAIAMVAYGGIVAATTLLTQSARIRVLDLCEDMLKDGRWSDDERAQLEWMVTSSSSSSVGLMVPVASISTFAKAVLGGPLKHQRHRSRLKKDRRFQTLAAYYMISIMGCSPFAALFSLPALIGTVMVRAIRGDRELRRAVESPVLEASASLRTC